MHDVRPLRPCTTSVYFKLFVERKFLELSVRFAGGYRSRLLHPAQRCHIEKVHQQRSHQRNDRELQASQVHNLPVHCVRNGRVVPSPLGTRALVRFLRWPSKTLVQVSGGTVPSQHCDCIRELSLHVAKKDLQFAFNFHRKSSCVPCSWHAQLH